MVQWTVASFTRLSILIITSHNVVVGKKFQHFCLHGSHLKQTDLYMKVSPFIIIYSHHQKNTMTVDIIGATMTSTIVPDIEPVMTYLIHQRGGVFLHTGLAFLHFYYC